MNFFVLKEMNFFVLKEMNFFVPKVTCTNNMIHINVFASGFSNY